MKLTKTMLEHFRCAYLYANGKVVIWHTQDHKNAGSVEWVTIHDSGIKCSFQGRIVLHRRGTLRLVAQASFVKAKEPCYESGSEATKKLGISVGYVDLAIGDEYTDHVHINVIDCLCSDFTVQHANVWTEPDSSYWGTMRIAA